jgi:hypothetical protein
MFRGTSLKKLATETAFFASDSDKDQGTYLLGGAMSLNHLMYKPEKTCGLRV